MLNLIKCVLLLSVMVAILAHPALARRHSYAGGARVHHHRPSHAKHYHGNVYPLEGQFDSKGRQMFRTRH